MLALEAVATLTRTQYALVRRQCADLPDLGGCLLLGRHYADPRSRIVFLGINPGGVATDLDVDLQPHNWLLEGPNEIGHAYWRNSRRFFSSTVTLKTAFRYATFAFCCPFRTKTWSGLPPAHRAVLEQASRPILMQILNDCRPYFIVVAGVAGERALAGILGDALTITGSRLEGGDADGTYQWSYTDATISNQPTRIVQVPHFSRANSIRRLEECAAWLSTLINQAGTTPLGLRLVK